MLIAYASVTSGLVTLATHIINDLGYAGIRLMIFISGVIAIPGTEAPMLFAGFNVSDGTMTLFGIIVAGVIGDVLGRRGRLLDRADRRPRVDRAPWVEGPRVDQRISIEPIDGLTAGARR